MTVAQILLVIVDSQTNFCGLLLVAKEVGKATRQYILQARQIRIVVDLGAEGTTLIETIYALMIARIYRRWRSCRPILIYRVGKHDN